MFSYNIVMYLSYNTVYIVIHISFYNDNVYKNGKSKTVMKN